MLVIAVVAVAYSSAAPQLAVAEFAPTAQRNLDTPPTTASGDPANGDGRPGRRTTTTTAPPAASTASTNAGTDAAAPTTRVGRARTCYGSPPRQAEDPMAPPCMATVFEGDNGGRTAAGVSATEIRVAVPGSYLPVVVRQTIDALFEYFNQRFELYGRRLIPVYVEGSPSTAVAARGLGADVAAQDVFAALTASSEWTFGQVALVQELARRGIVTVVRNGSTWWTDRTLFDELHPYVWSVFPSSEAVQANLGDFACRSLADHPAAFAGATDLRSATRRFGIVAWGIESVPNTSVLSNSLADCTGQTVPRVEGVGQPGSASAAIAAGMNRFKDQGVTTIVCVCEAYANGNFLGATNGASASYEWLLATSYSGTGYEEGSVQGARRANQIAPPIRLSPGPRLLPLQARPWYGALATTGLLTSTDVYSVMSLAEFAYSQLLVLAAGVQAAGPQLTPDGLAQGLMSTTFPNPGAGQAPAWQPFAGFGPGDHSFFDGYTVASWSDTAPALDQPISSFPTGSWCYLGGGSRFGIGTYPADAQQRLFNPAEPCR